MPPIQLLERAAEFFGIDRQPASPADVGLWDILSDEQIERAISFDGDDTHGDPRLTK